MTDPGTLAARRAAPARGRLPPAGPRRIRCGAHGRAAGLVSILVRGGRAGRRAPGLAAPVGRRLHPHRHRVDPAGVRLAGHGGRARRRGLHPDAGAGGAGVASSSSSTRWATSTTEPPASLGRYYVYQSLFAFSMMGLVLAPNFVQLFICWELVGLCSYSPHRLLVPAAGGGARGGEGVLDHQGRRRGLLDRHRAPVVPHRHLRLPRALRARARRPAPASRGWAW